MTVRWPSVPLGELLTRSTEWAEIDPSCRYAQITVRLWGEGIVKRNEVTGAEIAASRRIKVRRGQFLLSRIDARNGAFGIIPDELDGAVVSNDFPAFDVQPDRMLSSYLGWFSKTSSFIRLCKAASEGTTNRVRLKEHRFLSMTIPLPSLSEQRRIVARIEELAAKIEEARALRHQAAAEAAAVMGAAVSAMDRELRAVCQTVRMEDLASHEKGAMRSGPFGSMLLHSEFVEHGVPAIGIEDVQENRFVLTGRWQLSPEKATQLARFRIKPGDLLITVMGTLGRACVVPDDVPHIVSTKHVWTITLDPNRAFGPWTSYWLNFSDNVRGDLLGQATGTAIGGLNGRKIRAVSLPLIPLPDQRQIVAYLDGLQAKVGTLKRLQEETAALLDALLPSTLDMAFTGEL